MVKLSDSVKITVAVPVYNVSSYLQRCVGSLVHQTLKPFEIILIDDGSTDNSGDICDGIAKSNPMVRVIHKENSGLGLTCNVGIEEAKGTHIVFIDSDDWAYSTMLEELVSAYEQTGADAVICGYDETNESGRVLRTYRYEYEYFDQDKLRTLFIPRLMGSAPAFHDSICVGAKHVLYSLEIIKGNNLWFPSEREVVSEDFYFNFDYYMHSRSAVIIPAVAYAYVQHDGSITKSYRADLFPRAKELYLSFKETLQKENLWQASEYRLAKTFFIYVRQCVAQELTGGASKRRARFHEISSDKLLREIIDGYPEFDLDRKQRFFLRCLTENRYFALDLCARVGLL